MCFKRKLYIIKYIKALIRCECVPFVGMSDRNDTADEREFVLGDEGII